MDILSNPYLMVVFNALISGGAFLCFVLSICTVALKYPRNSVHYLTLLTVVMGITLLYAWFNLNTIIFRPEWLNYIFVGVNFFIGPGVFFFYKTTADPDFIPDKKARWLYAPGVIVLVLIPLLNLVAPQVMPADPRQFFYTGKPSFVDAIFTVALLQNGAYYIKLFLVTRPILKANKQMQVSGGLTAFLLFFGIITFINLYGMFAYIVRDIRHFYADACLITLLIVSFTVFALRYPHYFLRIRPE
jgi:hypothetical protein